MTKHTQETVLKEFGITFGDYDHEDVERMAKAFAEYRNDVAELRRELYEARETILDLDRDLYRAREGEPY